MQLRSSALAWPVSLRRSIIIQNERYHNRVHRLGGIASSSVSFQGATVTLTSSPVSVASPGSNTSGRPPKPKIIAVRRHLKRPRNRRFTSVSVRVQRTLYQQNSTPVPPLLLLPDLLTTIPSGGLPSMPVANHPRLAPSIAPSNRFQFRLPLPVPLAFRNVPFAPCFRLCFESLRGEVPMRVRSYFVFVNERCSDS